MSDLVQRLRKRRIYNPGAIRDGQPDQDCVEAAAEIEHLRVALEWIEKDDGKIYTDPVNYTVLAGYWRQAYEKKRDIAREALRSVRRVQRDPSDHQAEKPEK